MSGLSLSIPPDAQAFMDRVKGCTAYESIRASTPDGERSLPIFPGSRVTWHGVVQPDDIQWIGTKPDKPYYLVMVQTPKHRRDQCDWWWFSMDTTITVDAVQPESDSRPKLAEDCLQTGNPVIRAIMPEELQS